MKKFLLLCAIVCAKIDIGSSAATDSIAASYELKPIVLPGVTGPVGLDYFAYDSTNGKVWVAASNLGSVAVIDQKTDAVSQVSGFDTGEIERRGQERIVGPTSTRTGEGVGYLVNR